MLESFVVFDEVPVSRPERYDRSRNCSVNGMAYWFLDVQLPVRRGWVYVQQLLPILLASFEHFCPQ